MKIKSNQSGIAHVAVILGVVIILAIGAAGWKVWESRDKNISKQNGSSAAQKTDQDDAKSDNMVVKDGYKLYEDNNLTVQYPDSWTPYKESEQPEWVFFKSTDFVPATELGPSVKAGYQLEIRVGNAEGTSTFDESLSQAKKAKEDGDCGGDYEVIKIDGNQAIKSDMKCEGTAIYATLYKNGTAYLFRLNSLDEDKPEVRELFTNILNTVNIK